LKKRKEGRGRTSVEHGETMVGRGMKEEARGVELGGEGKE